jgi:hypothetical protein
VREQVREQVREPGRQVREQVLERGCCEEWEPVPLPGPGLPHWLPVQPSSVQTPGA